MAEHFDVIIVGAGLSGVGAAYHLQKHCPGKTFTILEGRDAMGGTWDLFRYPGVRSDSDMFTLGYRWRPWRGAKALAEGPAILDYVREAARENGIDHKVRYQHRVISANWSSDRNRWTLEVEQGADREPARFTCQFLYMCPGYYDYDAGYTPQFVGQRDFAGRIIHPQHWPEDYDYSGKRIVVIGSGATAMTLVPKLAERAAHVTMLQRSPTYVISLPNEDLVAQALRNSLPPSAAHAFTRWKNVLFGVGFYQATRYAPEFMRRMLIGRVQNELGADFDIETHFTPRYNPWDQRLCLIPDNDLFVAMRAGKASVKTELIDCFTRTGVRLQSGDELEADVIVTATGLEMKFLGGVDLHVDGRLVNPHETLNYKGCMFSDVPNMCCVFGYTNASWTLKADLVAEYICRVLRRMDKKGAARCTPRRVGEQEERPFLEFSSSYVQRGLGRFPKTGSRRPFRLYQNYLLDMLLLRYGRIDDGVLELTAAVEPKPTEARPASNRPRTSL